MAELINPYNPLAFIAQANQRSKQRRQTTSSIISSLLASPTGAQSGMSDGGVTPMSGNGTLPPQHGKFLMPVNSTRITSGFGTRTHPITGKVGTHTGIDLAARAGTPVYAVANGVVRKATHNGGAYGNQVVIGLGGGLHSMYGHLSSFTVRQGQRVRKGQVIGYVGSTGLSTGPHLHFETDYKGTPVNPRQYLGKI